jgi:hypothetical protein
VLLASVLVAINALSALDFALTYLQLRAGLITEANPLLAELFAASPGRAWLFKTAVMLAVSLVIWQQRRHRMVIGVAIGALLLYLGIIGYHVLGMRAAGII